MQQPPRFTDADVGTRFRMKVDWDGAPLVVEGTLVNVSPSANLFDVSPPFQNALTGEWVSVPMAGYLGFTDQQILSVERLP